jgi:hypothetical protein
MVGKYKVCGPNAAYGVEPGGSVTLDGRDPAVQLNAAAGILVRQDKPQMTCPACAEQKKQPPTLPSADELRSHYDAAHPGLVIPAWEEDN